MQRNQKKFVAASLAVILVGFGYYAFHHNQKSSLTPSPTDSQSPDEHRSSASSQPPSVSPPQADTRGADDAPQTGVVGGQEKTQPESASETVTQKEAPTVSILTGDLDGASPQKPKAIETAKAPEAPKGAAGCFQVEFKHQPIASHNDGEACTQHKNLVQLPLEDLDGFNPKSLCVKVNGTPVKHSFVKDMPGKVLVSAIAGPKAVITASYCSKGMSCAENCKIPKDDFLAAIGANTHDNEDEFSTGGAAIQWDPSKKSALNNVDQELDKEMGSLKKEFTKTNFQLRNVFQGWVGSKAKPSCQALASKK